METALIILADGFEEIEAVAVIDILRRADIKLTIAGLDTLTCTSARKLIVQADCTFESVQSTTFDAVILPGGEPGTTHLENSALLPIFLKTHFEKSKILAAICAAPRILEKHGFLTGKQATSFPSTKEKMKSCIYRTDPVVVDQTIITSRGAGTALEFAYTLVDTLKSKETAQKLKETMVYR